MRRDATSVGASGPPRPFEYIGDIDPTSPRPWPETERDWWAMHEKLVERVQLSDLIPPYVDDGHLSSHRLPQLVFYGDSITKRWEGTSLGQPDPRYDDLGDLFKTTFGNGSAWGKRAMKYPLLLGIGGSRTYDLIWRIENGEFPISRLVTTREEEMGEGGGGDGDVGAAREEGTTGRGRMVIENEGGEVDGIDDADKVEEEEGEEEEEEEEKEDDRKMKEKTRDDEVDEDKESRKSIGRRLTSWTRERGRGAPPPASSRWQRRREDDVVVSLSPSTSGRLERIYIVLIGTNNLGGGMLPGPTARGIDAVGRAILRLHFEAHPTHSGGGEEDDVVDVPAAILLSELLPRRDDHLAIRMCPPWCANVTSLEPYKSFMSAINEVNDALPEIAAGWRRDFPNSRIVLLSSNVDDAIGGSDGMKDDGDDGRRRIRVVDKNRTANESSSSSSTSVLDDYAHIINCGREMFAIDDESEFATYMPDGLHPNVNGYKLWSRCLNKGLAAIVADRLQ